MSATFGEHFRLTIFGESHGPAIGIVLDGLPAGFALDLDAVRLHMARRAPGNDPTSTPRREADEPRVLSGLYQGHTTGAPLAAVIENTNTRAGDYGELARLMRPGHADFAAFARFQGYADPRGGGHFSGRLTAPLVFAGSVARQLLAAQGITIGAHIAAIAGVRDAALDHVGVDASALKGFWNERFPLVDPNREAPMRAAIDAARVSGDSVGGQIEVAAVGVPAGIGSPFFRSVESVFSQLAFSIPAVKAVEFGNGTGMAGLRGSESNDPMRMKESRVACLTNHNGGVTGGITNGMPVIARLTLKPTPSIAREQQTVDVSAMEDATLAVRGRHDPCIVPRAVPACESALAIALLDLMLDDPTTALMGAERSLP